MNDFVAMGCHRVLGNKKCGGKLVQVSAVPSVNMMKCQRCKQVYTWEVWVDDLADYYPAEKTSCKISGT